MDKFGEIQSSFDLKLKEKESAILLKENELDILFLKKRKTIIIVLFTLFVFIISSAIVLIFKISLQNKQKVKEIKQQFLRFQMNPHFIFNTLNSIQYFIYKNNKTESAHYLKQFSSLMQMVLDNSKLETVSIKQEVETLKYYLELEKLRFDEKLNYKVILDANINENLKIPPMLIQPFVENAILHGIMPKEESGNLIIQINLVDEKVVCTIEDDGIGRERAMEIKTESISTRKSLGTKITESRLQLINNLYRKKLQIIYTDLKDEAANAIGTRVEISFPFILQ